MAQVKITLIRSVIDRPEKQKRTMEALGIHRMHGTKVHNDTPVLQGMLRVVRHLVKVEPAGE